MTREEKDLLLKDLCARLPYNVICKVEFRESGEYKSKNMFLSGVFTDEAYFTTESGSIYSNEYKPYLFPLSSMTKEQRCELHGLIRNLNMLAIDGEIGDWLVSSSEIDSLLIFEIL